ncbi:hypothetical protein ACFC4C_01530 [Streptomyces sp. NPDC056039]|uniref:hypothetical protein n=1 Tax=Streptomyces sp. NPDC056039 TaxID=3345687 RepID=UPI0035DED4A0
MPSHKAFPRRTVLAGAAATGAGAALWPTLGQSDAMGASKAEAGAYTIRFDKSPRQTIWGLGFEIQSDSIGSGNNGMDDKVISGVPYDLTEGERDRFYRQMLMGGGDRGFRYCRLALGLYHRGLDPTKKHLVDRYKGQTDLLADMIKRTGIEGVSAEYWSPAPGWKSNKSYIGGKLASFSPEALDALGDAMVGDLDYLAARGVPISMWGLQNEPRESTRYSSCKYTPDEYVKAFKAVAPKIKKKYPKTLVIADSQDGWKGKIGAAIKADPDAVRHVDAWTFHRVGTPSTEQIEVDFTSGRVGKPVFNNEFEYLHYGSVTPQHTIRTAQSIMNWMTFQNAPSWFWLHALKPTSNAEATGYALGYWRSPHGKHLDRFPDVKPRHWTFNPLNWNAVAGFLRYMPWDSVRYHVDEPKNADGKPDPLHRIMAWQTPKGDPVFVVTNASKKDAFTYTVDTRSRGTFAGHRYGPRAETNNVSVDGQKGPKLTLTVPPLSIEFWTPGS